jgi:hypothetical protein
MAVEATRVRNARHGHTRGERFSPEYRTWAHILSRCTNPNTRDYPRYGGRGITVCEEWRLSFESFFEHVGRRPSARHSIDRIDNSRGYEPGNVQWATTAQQNRNRRNNLWIEFNGERLVVIDWAARLGIPAGAIYHRIGRGIVDPARLLAPLQRRAG